MSAYTLTAQKIAQELARGRELARTTARRAGLAFIAESIAWIGLAAAAIIAVVGF